MLSWKFWWKVERKHLNWPGGGNACRRKQVCADVKTKIRNLLYSLCMSMCVSSFGEMSDISYLYEFHNPNGKWVRWAWWTVRKDSLDTKWQGINWLNPLVCIDFQENIFIRFSTFAASEAVVVTDCFFFFSTSLLSASSSSPPHHHRCC